MLKYPKILNSKGQEIRLTGKEDMLAKNLERKIKNDLGYEVNITTLTTIMKKISEQKFFEIRPSEYLPVVVGEGAWSSNLVTYRSFSMGEDFATGVLNQGANSSRLAAVDTGVDSLTIKVNAWAKAIGWNIIELEQASKAGNWDLVTSKEESRLKNYHLGIQKVAFLGLAGDAATPGLLGLEASGVAANTTRISKAISSMTTAELKVFVKGVIDDYRSNCNRTAWPTHFIIPESDYLGLASQASADFPIRTVLDLLLEAFRLSTRNPKFEILPLAYCDAAYNSLGVQKYVLLNYDEKSVRMNIPVDYTSTLANSLDNFSFQNVAFAQFTGVQALRPLEVLYFTFSA